MCSETNLVLLNLNEDWTLVEAIYFSLISLSTIGFGDLVPREEPPQIYGKCHVNLCHVILFAIITSKVIFRNYYSLEHN